MYNAYPYKESFVKHAHDNEYTMDPYDVSIIATKKIHYGYMSQ